MILMGGKGSGNFTKGRKNQTFNTTGLQTASTEKQLTKEHYIEIAKKQASVIRYGQEYAYTLMERLTGYIEETQAKKKPLTVSGMMKASGMGEDTYKRYRNGNADHLLYIRIFKVHDFKIVHVPVLPFEIIRTFR